MKENPVGLILDLSHAFGRETVRVIEQMVRAEQFLPNDQGFACGDCPYGLHCHYRLELAA